MASHGHLRSVATTELGAAITILDGLLPEDQREGLAIAQRDVIGRDLPDFKVAVLAGALARVVEAQQEEIDALKAKDSAKSTAKRSSSSRSSSSTTKSKK
jgi:hypothetical protein